MTVFANQYGKESGKPYFSLNGRTVFSKGEYARLFPVFNGKYGITNVWDVPPLHSKERVKVDGSSKYFHLNQKPLSLMDLVLSASTNPGDVIWEPFGGLFSASLWALKKSRQAFAAEIDPDIYQTALKRFVSPQTSLELPEQEYANAI